MTGAERAQQLREQADFSERIANETVGMIFSSVKSLLGDRALANVSTSERSTPEWRAFIAAQVAYREAQLMEDLARKRKAEALAAMQRAEAALAEADGRAKPVEDEG